jgi:hypothetical protein
MPHAEHDPTSSTSSSANDTMTEVLTNGEKPSSQFISHLTSYPVVSDSIGFYKGNPYGAKSISLASDVYERFFAPVQPYFKTPYSYVAPYLEKADSLGDAGLGKIDTTFPVVKEDTATLKTKVTDVAFFPLALGAQGKDYVFSTYSEQRKGSGVEKGGIISKALAEAKAVIYTEYKIGSDAFYVLASFLSQKKEEGKKFADQKLNN